MRAAAAAVLVLLLALPAWGAPPRRATLKLESRAPFVVQGRNFGARERIVVTASWGDARRAAAARADRQGRFAVRFDLCTQVTVRAVGARGSRASLLLQPGCDDDEEVDG